VLPTVVAYLIVELGFIVTAFTSVENPKLRSMLVLKKPDYLILLILNNPYIVARISISGFEIPSSWKRHCYDSSGYIGDIKVIISILEPSSLATDEFPNIIHLRFIIIMISTKNKYFFY